MGIIHELSSPRCPKWHSMIPEIVHMWVESLGQVVMIGWAKMVQRWNMESKHAWFVCISLYRTSILLLIAKILHQLRLVTGSISHSFRSVFYTSKRSVVHLGRKGFMSINSMGELNLSDDFVQQMDNREKPTKIRKIHCYISIQLSRSQSFQTRLDRWKHIQNVTWDSFCLRARARTI